MDRRTRTFVIAGLIAAVLIAGGVSLLASDQPDGLERVAIDEGFDDTATDPGLDSPLADYAVEGIEDEGLSRSVAGVIGVAVTLVLTMGILWVVRWRRRTEDGA